MSMETQMHSVEEVPFEPEEVEAWLILCSIKQLFDRLGQLSPHAVAKAVTEWGTQ